MASIHNNEPINKKKALDDIIGEQSVDGRSLHRCMNDFVHTLNIVKRMFPDLHTTRFANAVDFYSLLLLVNEMDKQRCLLTDRKRNRQAGGPTTLSNAALMCRSCNARKGAR